MNKHVRPAIITVVTLLFHLGITALALRNASGVVPRGDDTYDTEMLNYPTLAITLISLGLLVYVAVTSPVWGLLLTAGLTAISVWGANAEIEKWENSGFAQGLEIFAYLVPAGVMLLGLMACGVGTFAELNRRSTEGTLTPRPE